MITTFNLDAVIQQENKRHRRWWLRFILFAIIWPYSAGWGVYNAPIRRAGGLIGIIIGKESGEAGCWGNDR